MRILVACEKSGVVRRAFRARGFDAWSADLQESEDDSQYHIHGNVLDVLYDNWDGLIAHPPCTRLCNSGVHLLESRNLWQEMELAAFFFKEFLDCGIRHIAIENPIMHKYAMEIIQSYPDQCVQPWQFGEPWKKGTCFWLRNLPKLKPTKIVKPKHHMLEMSPSDDRADKRSRTFEGIAKAMAEQWGDYMLNPNPFTLTDGIC